MRTQSKFVTAAAALMLLLPVSALAADKNSSKVDFPEKVVMNGHEIQPGTYRVEWTGTGDNVQVSVLQGHKTLAEAPARLVNGNYENAIVTHDNGKGASVVDQIQMKNKEIDLRAAGSNPNATASNSGS